MTIEERFPLAAIQPLARLESQRRQFYRPIYSIHKTWARRPGTTFRAIGLAHFYEENDLFDPNHSGEGAFYQNHDFQGKIALDPFCGGGTSIIEFHRLGIKTIGIDVNPIAWLTTKKEFDPFSEEIFDQEVERIFQSVGKLIKSYYKSVCPQCNSSNADIMYVFWVRTILCPSCDSEEDLFKYYIIGKKQRKNPATMVICPQCDHLFYTGEKMDNVSICPQCSRKFIPKFGNCRLKQFTCTSCQKEFKLIELLLQSINRLSARQIAIEFFCQNCGVRDYKKVTEKDKNQYQRVKEEFLKKKNKLLFPRELLPQEGKNISNLRNYGFKRFSELFNKRQLLCLSLLLEAITHVSDSNIKEFLLTAFSSSLEFHTVICPYNYTMKQIVNIFNYQSFLVPTMYVENNVWGTKKGNGTFITYLERIKKAKSYCKSPFEITLQKDQIVRIPVRGDRIEADVVDSFQTLITNESADTLLINDTSEDLQVLGIPHNSVDIVVTDPPYFDFIQYNELANFFFVWLKQGLSSQYPSFRSNLIQTDQEVTISQEKENFLNKITKVFQECHRVLKSNAPLVFTFHHSNVTAWAMILEALYNSEFLITAAFPVRSEFGARPVKGRNFDIILVCRKIHEKISSKQPMDWESLESQIKKKIIDISASSVKNLEVAAWEETFATFLPEIALMYSQNPLVNLVEILSKIFNYLKNIKILCD
ncbi:MAG: DNA methyltransferase [Candidatus Hodarchaeota archaeon]